jgi:hypothetical protein
MPARTNAGVLGMARTTGAGLSKCRSMNEVVAEAAIDTTSWSLPITGLISASASRSAAA